MSIDKKSFTLGIILTDLVWVVWFIIGVNWK